MDLGKWKNSPPVRGKWVINVYGKISGATWVTRAGREPRQRQKHLRGEATSFVPPQAVQNPLVPYITNTLRKGRTRCRYRQHNLNFQARPGLASTPSRSPQASPRGTAAARCCPRAPGALLGTELCE